MDPSEVGSLAIFRKDGDSRDTVINRIFAVKEFWNVSVSILQQGMSRSKGTFKEEIPYHTPYTS